MNTKSESNTSNNGNANSGKNTNRSIRFSMVNRSIGSVQSKNVVAPTQSNKSEESNQANESKSPEERLIHNQTKSNPLDLVMGYYL